MNSCVSVLQKLAAIFAFVESHDTSMIRFVPEERARMAPAAVAIAWCHNVSVDGGLICSALRHIPRRSGGCKLSGGGSLLSFSCTRAISEVLCSSRTCVWMSLSR